MRRKQVRFGIIGLGIGGAHADGIRADGRGAIAALCDVDEKRLAQRARDWDASEVFTDYRKLCRSDLVDAVCVCTPNALHAPMAVEALRRGKHVLVEKPLSVNAQEGAKIVRAARNARRQVAMMAFSTRFGPEAQAMKAVVDSGRLGRVYYAKAAYTRRKGIPGFGGWFTTKAMSGGGPLIDIGVHVLETTWWLMGGHPPASVSGSTYSVFGKRGMGSWGTPVRGGTFDVEDLACGVIKLADGSTIFLECSWAQHTEPEHNVQLFGTEGGLRMSPRTIFTDMFGGEVNIEYPVTQKAGGHAREISHFIDCIIKGVPCEAPIEHGLHVQRMLDGIYESANTGREVRFRVPRAGKRRRRARRK